MEFSVETDDICKDEYLAGLNVCFPNWGHQEKFHEIFVTKSGSIETAFIGIREKTSSKLIAGSAVTYRLMTMYKSVILVGIMTGSWTLPEARGQGLFSVVIQHSLELVKQKNGRYLLAFVISENASCRRLNDAGSLMVPTRYLFSSSSSGKSPPQKKIVQEPMNQKTLENIFLIFKENRKNSHIFFNYSFQQWTKQYSESVDPISIWTVGENVAVVEEKKDIIKILFCSGSLGEPLEKNVMHLTSFFQGKKGKGSMFFSTKIEESAYLERKGFAFKSGYLCILSGEQDMVISQGDLSISNGDRM